MARMPRPTAYPQQLPEAIDHLLPQTLFADLSVHGNTRWTPWQLLLTAALMSWHESPLLTARFEQVREILARIFPQQAIPTSYSGYAEALARWMPQLVRLARPHLQERIRRLSTASWKIAGWIVFAADGSRFEAPRTRENEQELQCAGIMKTAPQLFQTTLLHLGTNALWDFRVGPGTASERRQLEEMATDLPPGSLVVADAGLIGYELCLRLMNCGVSFLLRVGGNITLLTEQLGVRMLRQGQEVWLWPPRHRGRLPLVLRLLVYKKGHKRLYLITNVLEPRRLTRRQAAEIYRRRWGIEVTYRSIKQTLQRRAWLSRVPRTVLAEQLGTLLGFWILQVLSLQALCRSQQDVRTWSPARSRNVTRRVMRHALRSAAGRGEASWQDQLGSAVRDTYVRHRTKQSRDWPHQKHDPPIQPPWVCLISPPLLQKGRQLLTAQNTG